MDTGASPDPAKIRGVDVSHLRGSIDWSLVAKEGVAFAFIKATEGTSFIDPQFHANWNGAHAAGLLRGAYHFYVPSADPHQQALSFMRVVQTGPGDLPPVLDIELPKDPREMVSPSEIVSGIQAWLAAVEQGTGKVPILYTNLNFWAKLGATNFGRFPLWIAEYGVDAPKIPEGWKAWSFWQYSSSGSIPGIQAPVDLDLFQGTLPDLQQLAQSSL